MSLKLLPCPFCGGAFKMSAEAQDNYPVAGKLYIYHEYGPLGSKARACRLDVHGYFDSEDEVDAFWNTRVQDDNVVQQ